jgi:hypothetical protein
MILVRKTMLLFLSFFLFLGLYGMQRTVIDPPVLGEKVESPMLPYGQGGPKPRNEEEQMRSPPSGAMPADMIFKEGAVPGTYEVMEVNGAKGAPYKKGDIIHGPIDGKSNPLPAGAKE